MVNSTDVLIIGSGPVGATYARLLCERRSDLKIVMIDAGPALSVPAGRHVRNMGEGETRRAFDHLPEAARPATGGGPGVGPATAVGSGSEIMAAAGTILVNQDAAHDEMPAAATSTNVGGMGALWTCSCPWPDPAERVPFIDSAAWDAMLQTASGLLRVSQQTLAGSLRSEVIRETLSELLDRELPEGRRVQQLPLAYAPAGSDVEWTGVDTILGPLLGAGANGSFELHPETVCRRLATDGDRVEGAIVEHLPTGETAQVRARAVVVACDGLRTPQLLWASGIRPDALGRWLNDHPATRTGVILKRVLVDEIARRAGGAQHRIPPGDPACAAWIPFSPAHPVHIQVLSSDAISPAWMSTEVDDDRLAMIGLGTLSRKEPRYEDRIIFSDSEVDGLGLPRMTFHYRLTPSDEQQLEEDRGRLERAALALGNFVPGREPRTAPLGSSLHYQGATRMGESTTDSVCDSFSNVWGLRNVWVGGNGVIASSTAGNPTLTAVSLAVRAVESVVESV